MVVIRNIKVLDGIPKICVPLVGQTIPDLIDECRFLQGQPYDLLELRIDFFNEVTNLSSVENAIDAIRTELPDGPLIFTFRTKKEGGETEVSEDYYFKLIDYAIHSGKIDAIDIELFSNPEHLKKALAHARAKAIPVILSNHDFSKTPPVEEIALRLEEMVKLGADIAKIACMPQTAEDVLIVLKASYLFKLHFPETPIVTMSMGQLGVISRLCGETFGSAITFGSAKAPSAPGQIRLDNLKYILDVLH